MTALHAIYLAIHADAQRAGKIRQQHLSILREANLLRDHGWRVVGITPAALAHMASRGFKDTVGLHRAHLRPQSSFLRETLDRATPFTEAELEAFLDAHDRTILATKAENKTTVAPEFIPLDGRAIGIKNGTWAATITAGARAALASMHHA